MYIILLFFPAETNNSSANSNTRTGITPIRLQSRRINETRTPRRRARDLARSREIRPLHGLVLVLELSARRRRRAGNW